MARNSLHSQPVCTALFSCQHCLAPLTRCSPCNPSLHLFQSCFLLECESPNHICPEGNNKSLYNYIRASLPLVNSVFSEARSLFFCKWLKIYLLFISIACLITYLTDFGKSGLNPTHLDLNTTAIFAAQHCFISPLNSGLECFPRFFSLAFSICIYRIVFIPLIRYFLSSLHLQVFWLFSPDKFTTKIP